MKKDTKIYVAGHNGLVGSAIVRVLEQKGFSNVIGKSHNELDLTDQVGVNSFFNEEKPDYVFLAAAKVGGIHANNSYPADFIRSNLLIQDNVIHASYKNNVKKLLFLGSSCIYPKLAPQPLKEEYLLSGPLEPTNEWYAIAKIAGIKTCQAYNKQYGFNAISLMPTNLYGPGDNFDLETSHVLPALIRKFHEAKIKGESNVSIWGSGIPKREFLHVDDLADAACFLMEKYNSPEIINVGTGKDISIGELAEMIRDIIDCPAEIQYNSSKPDGTPRKLLDVTRLNDFGWSAGISLRDGIASTYEWFIDNQDKIRK
ncbi:GDP-L-fucose synthase family protein [Thermodesulfobacteriota bacterium]